MTIVDNDKKEDRRETPQDDLFGSLDGCGRTEVVEPVEGVVRVALSGTRQSQADSLADAMISIRHTKDA